MEKLESIRKFIGPSAESMGQVELVEADEVLREYVALAVRIFRRLEALTPTQVPVRMNSKGPHPQIAPLDP